MRSTCPMVMMAGLLVLGTASCGGDSALGPGDLGTGNVNVWDKYEPQPKKGASRDDPNQ